MIQKAEKQDLKTITALALMLWQDQRTMEAGSCIMK